MVYYNEIDPRAVAWLRELMKAGQIPDGEVDTRSIVDVRPADLVGFRQCHFFAGIGGWAYALRLAGWPDDRECWTGSCPCQPWSVAGSGEGVDDPRHLWPAWFPLIRERRPCTLFGEQTSSLDGRYWLDLVLSQMEGIEYAIGAFDLPAAGAGAPHARARLWIVADDHRAGRGDVGRAGMHRSRESRSQLDDRGGPRGMADALRDGVGQHPGELSGDEGQHAERSQDGDHGVRRRGAARRVGDAGGRRFDPRSVGSASDEAALQGPRKLRTDDTGVMGDAASSRPQRRTTERSARSRNEGTATERAGAACSGLADADGRHADERAIQRHDEHGLGAQDTRSSFWSACDWIPCIDGKARPVEPGTFPLAHGVPARVGRLRGYGNAIVPEVAALVIGAYMSVSEGAPEWQP